jgi:hypothetical protein
MVAVLSGLTLSAGESLAFAEAPVADVAAPLPAALPFVDAAPSPFVLMLVGLVIVAATFGRRYHRLSSVRLSTANGQA